MPTARFIVSPEVAGELGADTVMDTSVHPPRVSRLHYELHGWLGDDLLESFPVFVVTDRLARALRGSDLSGWRLGPVQVTKSDEFEELHPDRELPGFFWLQVDGDGAADFALSADHRLEVSERALELLRRFQIDNALVDPAAP